jgi:hypothetical protein
MKKVILSAALAAMIAVTVGANETSNKTLCQSLAMGFGNSYDMTKKNTDPREYCGKIVREKKANEDICTFNELTDGCVNQIALKQKK